MSDKKTPTNPPTAQDTPEREFDRFLRGEDTATAASYRKLPHAEPDATLDARVRALARQALRDAPPAAANAGPSGGGGARADIVRARSSRWMPAFASAAVLVLAAGVVWQLGPRNWARKDVTTDIALDATTARSSSPAADDAKPDQAASVASRTSSVDAGGVGIAAKSTGARQPNAADEAKPPLAFPAQTSAPEPAKPRAATPAVSGASPAALPQAASRKEEVARDAVALAERARAPEPPEAPREKRLSDTPGELKKERAGQAPATTAPATVPPNLAAQAAPDDRVANGATVHTPAPVAAARVAPAPPAPPPPPVNAETTPMRDQAVAQGATPARIISTPSPPVPSDSAQASTFPAAPAAAAALADARRQDEVTTQQAPQRATAPAESPATGSVKAQPAPAPSAATAPAPAPMQAPASPSAFAPSPSAAPDAAASKTKASSAAAGSEAEAQKQAYADHFALPPGSPPAKIPGRPTPAQLAAWPAPNCHAAGTVTSSGGGNEARMWNYPPDVPDSAQLRFVIVKSYLEAESPEGARKAYADFRQCHPEDSWPASLLRRLGVQ